MGKLENPEQITLAKNATYLEASQLHVFSCLLYYARMCFTYSRLYMEYVFMFNILICKC